MKILGAFVLSIMLITTSGCQKPPPVMNQARLEELIQLNAGSAEGRVGARRFVYDGVPMICLSDESNDRMRIVAPVAQVADLEPQHLGAALVANFHTALDARYAISRDVLYAAYLHPLSSLTEPQLGSALRQLVSLVRSFGRDYTSGTLHFGDTHE